jgi:hypothetical protein
MRATAPGDEGRLSVVSGMDGAIGEQTKVTVKVWVMDGEQP